MSIAFLVEFGVVFGGFIALMVWELYRTHKAADAQKLKDQERDT
ncbi:MAG: hypothetical protein AAGJ32_10430 [Pseudomonadota bacterium]